MSNLRETTRGPERSADARPWRPWRRLRRLAGRLRHVELACLVPGGWLLLADRAPFHSLGRNFRGRHSQFDKGDIYIAAAIFVGAAIALWVLHRLLARQDGERIFHSRRALFQGLCRAHGLTRTERQLLARLARWQQLSEPARIFLEIDRFDLAGAPASLAGRVVELESLRQRLFADSGIAPAATKPARHSRAGARR